MRPVSDMAEMEQLHGRQNTIGEAAVDGLLGGILAGACMALYLVVVGVIAGDEAGLILSSFAPSPEPSPLSGALAHLAVSGVYGILFGVVWRPMARSRVGVSMLGRWLPLFVGLLYGLVLMLVAEMVTLRLSAASSPLRDIALLHLLVAHLIYGLVLSFLVGRRRSNLAD